VIERGVKRLVQEKPSPGDLLGEAAEVGSYTGVSSGPVEGDPLDLHGKGVPGLGSVNVNRAHEGVGLPERCPGYRLLLLWGQKIPVHIVATGVDSRGDNNISRLHVDGGFVGTESVVIN